jgi:hypothetical protein
MPMKELQIGNNGSEHILLSFNDDDLKRDGWLEIPVAIKVDGFFGEITACFENDDFIKFESDLEQLNLSLAGSVILRPREEQLVLQFEGDRLGHIKVSGTAFSYATYGNKLTFSFAIDQSYLSGLIAQLKVINQATSNVGI